MFVDEINQNDIASGLTGSTAGRVNFNPSAAGDYLTKPYTKQRLTDALDRLIEKRRNRLYIPVSCGKEIHRTD